MLAFFPSLAYWSRVRGCCYTTSGHGILVRNKPLAGTEALACFLGSPPYFEACVGVGCVWGECVSEWVGEGVCVCVDTNNIDFLNHFFPMSM